MAVGKNKGLTKGGKKGGKRKVIDPFSRKDWYDVKAPNLFQNRQIGKTLVNRTQGQRIASDYLKGRVFEVLRSDLQKEDNPNFRKFHFIAEDVQDRNVLCNFHGMELTTDKYRSSVKKWQTLIEAIVDVRTIDGYLLRFFCMSFTLKNMQSLHKTCYIKRSKVRKIRQRMTEIIVEQVSAADLKQLINKMTLDSISKDIEEKCKSIYPLYDTYIRKVKVLRKPRFDISKLLELHGDGGGTGRGTGSEAVLPAEGAVIDRTQGYELPVFEVGELLI